MILLCKPLEELKASVPKAGAQSASLQSSQAVMELRGLMEEVKTLKTEREVIETTLRSVTSIIEP